MSNSIEEKVIMYDSPEAAPLVTVSVYEINSNPNGVLYTPKEEVARYNNCTHKVCECGKPMYKHYTKCEDCRSKSAKERYNALPFKEWDGKEPICTWDGDTYFFNEDDLIEYMMDDEDEPMESIDLLICEPIHYRKIDTETVADETHDDWEPTNELLKKINEFNDYLKTLHPHSWTRGKIRTNYTLPKD